MVSGATFREGSAVKMMADIDEATGAVVLDDSGEPVMVRHYSPREAEPHIGVSHNTIRRKVQSGEWPGRIQPNGDILLTLRHMADIIHKLTGTYSPAFRWPEDLSMGVRGLVVDDEEVDQ